MSLLATTRLSSKGQVVIPEDVRKSLKLRVGDQFVVIGRGDTVILKTISPPPFSEFSDLLDEAQRQARAAGLKRADVVKVVREVRRGT
jgi:AbrB family looped-hinge helix DNA binding protein